MSRAKCERYKSGKNIHFFEISHALASIPPALQSSQIQPLEAETIKVP